MQEAFCNVSRLARKVGLGVLIIGFAATALAAHASCQLHNKTIDSADVVNKTTAIVPMELPGEGRWI